MDTAWARDFASAGVLYNGGMLPSAAPRAKPNDNRWSRSPRHGVPRVVLRPVGFFGTPRACCHDPFAEFARQ